MDAATEVIDARYDYYVWVQGREFLRIPVRDTIHLMAENILDYAWEGVHNL